MAKMQIIFDGFAELAEQIDRAEGDLHAAVDEALTETQTLVQRELKQAAAPYAPGRPGRKGYATGAMYESIIDSEPVEWAGTVATVHTGFSAAKNKAGFMHSIFVMYGTPKMAKDQKVYNAIKGARVKKKIAEKQEEVLREYLKLGGKQG